MVCAISQSAACFFDRVVLFRFLLRFFFFFDSVGGANGLGFLLAFRPASLVSLAAPLNSRLPRVVVAVVVVVVVVVVVDSCVRRRNICRPCVTLSVRVNSSIVVFVLRFVNIRRCVATLLKPKY